MGLIVAYTFLELVSLPPLGIENLSTPIGSGLLHTRIPKSSSAVSTTFLVESYSILVGLELILVEPESVLGELDATSRDS